MAKYTRFDPRNKKKDNEKNRYLGKVPPKESRKKFSEDYEDERDPDIEYLYKKFNL